MANVLNFLINILCFKNNLKLKKLKKFKISYS